MKLLGVLVSAMFLPASICASDDLFPFKLGEELFDNEVTQWHAGIISNLVEAADTLKADSDMARWAREQTKKDLNDLTKDETSLALAKNIYIKIQQDKAVKEAFQTAKQTAANKEALDKRIEAWRAFRKVTAQQLDSMRKADIPDIQDPTPGSPNAFIELLELNKEVTLTDELKNLFDAYHFVIYALRQNHRLIDEEVDGRTFLLHNKVTDPQS